MNFIADSKTDLARINLWYPARTHKKIYEDYDFKEFGKTWRHRTMSEQEAILYVRKIYLMESDTVFLPPFSSIFDQWPVLAAYGLSQKEIYEVFQKYYFTSKKFLQEENDATDQ